MNEKRTSLQLVTDILKKLQASTAFLVEYIPNSDEYRATPKTMAVPIEQLEQKYKEKLKTIKFATKSEIGIASRYIDRNGKEGHIIFADLDGWHNNEALPYGYVLVKSSTEKFHAYLSYPLKDVAQVSAQLLIDLGNKVDVKWMANGLRQGFHVLRISAQSHRFNKFGEPTTV